MTRVAIAPDAGQAKGAAIGAQHLGANYLFNRVDMQQGVGSGRYDETAANLGVSHVRYPGGTMTERQFDPDNPDNDYQPTDLLTGEPISNETRHHLTPISEFLDQASESDWAVAMVVPTARYVDMLSTSARQAQVEAEIKGFIRSTLADPNGGTVEIFEIGNEWQAIGLTAAEYGGIADLMAVWIAEEIAEAGLRTPPQIALQLAPKAARLDETSTILAQMGADALDAIDTVIIHNYRPMPWEDPEVTSGKFDHVDLAETTTGRDLEVLVSEWNIGNASTADGLLQGAGMLEMFHQMLLEGMDRAHIWPILENNTTRLAFGPADEGEPEPLTIAGEVYHQMSQSLRGLRALDIPSRMDTNGDGGVDMLLQAFGGASNGMVVFLSSLQEAGTSVSLDLTGLASRIDIGGEVWLTTTDVVDGADPTSHKSQADVRSVSISGLVEGITFAPLLLDLDPYEIVRLEFPGASMHLQSWQDGEDVDDFRLGTQADVVLLERDGERDLIRNFDLNLDRIDVSGLGIASLAELEITELLRSDGSVSWLGLGVGDGSQEALVRALAGQPLEATLLDAGHFIFANAAPDVPAGAVITDTQAYDALLGTEAAEVFRLTKDDTRDLLRDFDLARDHIDVAAWGVRSFDELTISEQRRKDGSVNWVNVFDSEGIVEIGLRYADRSPLDPTALTADHFVFATGTFVGLGTPRRLDTEGFTRLDGTNGAEIFRMLDDGTTDLIRAFELGVDKLDLSAMGISGFDALTLVDQTRRDGSVNWVQVLDATGEVELKMRFDGAPLGADQLDADDFIF